MSKLPSEVKERIGSIEHPWKNEDLLRDLYFEHDQSYDDIAELLGCAKSTVARWMDNHGIETPNTHQARRSPHPTFRLRKDGYEIAESRVGQKHKQVRIHQLIAISEGHHPWHVFAPNVHIHHKNNIPWDNRPANIEVVSNAEHNRRTWEHRKNGVSE